MFGKNGQHLGPGIRIRAPSDDTIDIYVFELVELTQNGIDRLDQLGFDDGNTSALQPLVLQAFIGEILKVDLLNRVARIDGGFYSASITLICLDRWVGKRGKRFTGLGNNFNALIFVLR